MIISRTPFRISFFGGGTDFPEFFLKHGGSTLLTTIDKYCYISIHRLSPFFKHRFRASYAKTELVQSPEDFEHPLIRESLLMLGIEDGLEIAHVADLPGRTGLGSSSSFTVGLLHCLHTFKGETATPEDLTRESIIVERERVKDSGGHQDQYAAAHGGLVRIDFSDKDPAAVRRLNIHGSRLHELENKLMLFYMGIESSAEEILTEQKKRFGTNERSLLEMLDLVDRAEGILCSDASLDEFGDLIHETWERKKSLSSGISTPAIDGAYEVARRAGARGGKLLGAGGRGFLLVYAGEEYQPEIRKRLDQLQEVHFGFSPEGSRIIFQTPES
ncbi:MAG: kinase [Verrucomicrobia bacterium]|nr:kinase [Verrucomicrobiota bacterium]